MKKISEHFTDKEFACKCGCGLSEPSPALMVVLEKIRDLSGDKTVRIVSGRRCPKRNKQVGGAPNSQHLKGTAADIQIDGMAPRDVARLAETVLDGWGGIGRYATFTHVDVRKTRARWSGKGNG